MSVLSRYTVLCVIIFLVACTRPENMKNARVAVVPQSGWAHGACISFEPQYGDTCALYDLTLSVRHTTAYPYRDLNLLVDIVGKDTITSRHRVRMELADAYGGWQGAGFGGLYQCSVELARAVAPVDARFISVWQVMDSVNMLSGVNELVVTATLSH